MQNGTDLCKYISSHSLCRGIDQAALAVSTQDSNMRQIRALIVGPPDSPYEFGFYEVCVCVLLCCLQLELGSSQPGLPCSSLLSFPMVGSKKPEFEDRY